MKSNRRTFIQHLAALISGFLLGNLVWKKCLQPSRRPNGQTLSTIKSVTKEKDQSSKIWISQNGTPEENIIKICEMMGGIESIIDKRDIVIIKPNAQWRYHGNTNTNTIKGFIDLILDIPSFQGEIVIIENHHDYPDNSRGWTTELRNGDFNLNELVAHYQNAGHTNVTKYHLRDAGPNPNPLQFPGSKGHIVSGPEQGDGYVWSDIEYQYMGRSTKMTYPIFTSSFSGITIDFKNGAWQNKHYINRPVKFINFAVLNHHSRQFGVTASIKNYLGLVDMTCGEQGTEPKGYYNFHYISVGWSRNNPIGKSIEKIKQNSKIRQSRFFSKGFRKLGPVYPEALGGAVGCFMNTIRKADLNILAAEYVGPEDRIRSGVQAKTVLASEDPVALDYWGAKYVLFPLGGPKSKYNNPDWQNGPFRRYLGGCHSLGIGTLDEKEMDVRQFRFE